MVKRRQVFVAITLIAIILVAIGISFFSVFPVVDYWLDPYTYFQDEEGWRTMNFHNNISAAGTFTPINCKNAGLLPATFEITIVFSGAIFSTDTPMPCQQINQTAAKFTFTVDGFQEKKIDVYFTILNETRFAISLSITSNQGLLRVANAQKSSVPWDVSYRVLFYYFHDNKFVAAMIQ